MLMVKIDRDHGGSCWGLVRRWCNAFQTTVRALFSAMDVVAVQTRALAAMQQVLQVFCTMLITVSMLCCTSLFGSQAWAQDGDDQTDLANTSQTTNSDGNNADDDSESDANGAATSKTDAARERLLAASSEGVSMYIDDATAIMTASSGYSLRVIVVNNSDTPLQAGMLHITTNTYYTFVSRSDLNRWLADASSIYTPHEIVVQSVAEIQARSTATVNVQVAADNAVLRRFMTWGPKPISAVYEANDANGSYVTYEVPMLVTRSSDGLAARNTPTMNLNMMMPLTSTWSIDEEGLSSLLDLEDDADDDDDKASDSESSADSSNGSGAAANKQNSGTAATDDSANAGNSESNETGSNANNAEGDATTSSNSTTDGASPTSSIDLTQYSLAQRLASQTSTYITNASQDAAAMRRQVQLITKYPSLQCFADPTYVNLLNVPPQTQGILQLANFDITLYAALLANETAANALAISNIDSELWNASTALAAVQLARSDSSYASPVVAWQGKGNWTLSALTAARSQGYTAVIATHDFDTANETTVHTGIYVVPTDAGDITVYAAQGDLSTLAQGEMTSEAAIVQKSVAGRVSSFVALSAFYQMEQPFVNRYLMASFDVNASSEDVSAFMDVLGQADWLTLTDFAVYSAQASYASGFEALTYVPADSGMSDEVIAQTASNLQSLAASRSRIEQFTGSILDSESSNSEEQAQGDQAAKDVGALASQDIGIQSDVAISARDWASSLLSVHSLIAEHGLGDSTDLAAFALQLTTFSSQLFDGISLNSSTSVNVVSETASLPISISNSYPYPVTLRISALTDSMEIVTSRIVEVRVPGGGEAQTSFTIRATTASQANAHVVMMDRNGRVFGAPQDIEIISTLRLSDKSGFSIIVVGVALCLIGLWRQCKRTKDPDE